MRGEVMLLSRNIKLAGQDAEGWGCQVMISDLLEGNGEIRNGSAYLDHVEIYNCSQVDTFKAALRFEKAKMKHSTISNCAIHHGNGIGVQIYESSNILLKGNIIFDFVRFSLNVENVKNMTIDNNWIFITKSRHLHVGMTGDPVAAVAGCARPGGTTCSGLSITNNIAAGVEAGGVDTAGYAAMGH